MPDHGQRLQQRADGLRSRIEALMGLRRLVNLAPEQDITARQWAVLEPKLGVISTRLTERVRQATDGLITGAFDTGVRRGINDALGRVELDLAKAYAFFDTYMDVLTQRRTPGLGAVLAGCDVLAYEAMRRDHPALSSIEPPLVYCDRGFGASIIRESVRFPDGSQNPMPLIQIPYSRLNEKCNLTSIMHEAGHQALQRLGLVAPMATALGSALAREGTAPPLRELYARWSFEIGPDFWAFCLCGPAEAQAVRSLFALPQRDAMRVSFTDPHPPPYLRSMLAFDWCRRAWGRGPWDEWEREWLDLYPLQGAPPAARKILAAALRAVPLVGAALFDTRFPQLGKRTLPQLFDLDSLAPSVVGRIARHAGRGVLDLRGVTPCRQLAVFAELRTSARLDEKRLDRLMSEWLRRLGARRHTMH
jgi:hypothetical protein